MRLTFLGTSAGESYPAIWCDCENCTYARKHGGRNLRMNTGSMIDDDVLLDMNSCGFYTAARLGLSLTGVTKLLVTHPHPDHLTVEPLAWRHEAEGTLTARGEDRLRYVGPRFTPLPEMTVYGNAAVRKVLVGEHPELFRPDMAMRFEQIFDGQRVDAGDLAFTPVRAVHGPEWGFAHSFIIERGGRTLLYALDTGGYEEDMLDILYAHRYDAVVMEGTFGLGLRKDPNHQHHASNVAFRDALQARGCIAADTPFYLTHMSPHWTPPYDIYAPMMEKEGFIVAWDGLQVEI